jgi:hypothetical protein
MSERNGDGDGPHQTAAVLPPAGKPFASGYNPRRNAGRRPARRVRGYNGQALGMKIRRRTNDAWVQVAAHGSAG